jgi:hypothetical protein
MENFRYPEETEEFNRGTVYQVLDPISKQWSEDKYISKVCNSTKEWLWLLIKRNSIRIKND